MHAIQGLHVEQGTPEWRAARRNGVGGSDAAAVVGLDPYKTPIDVYNEKLGLIPEFTGNWNTKRGNAMEPLMRQHYAEKIGVPVHVPARMLHHPKHHFMFTSLDGFATVGGVDRLWEGKTAVSGSDWGDEGTDQIPVKYGIQVQHALCVLGVDVSDVSVSIAGMEPKYYVVERDRDLQEMIVEREHDFWQSVTAKKEPEPQTTSEIIARTPMRHGTSAVITSELNQKFAELLDVRVEKKEAEARESELKEIIQQYLARNSATILMDAYGAVLATWNEQTRISINANILKSLDPAIFAQVAKASTSRTLLIKN